MSSIPPPRSGKYAGYWKIKRFRRGARNTLSAWLARSNASVPVLQPLDPAQVRRVIVCRRNKRLGNMLFLTPLLRSLAATMPHAEIDVLISNADYVELFQGLPRVRHVWSMPARGWRWPFRMLGLLLQLRARHYDLVIEPSLHSFSNRLLARLCAARWRLGFHTPSQWLNLTHNVVPEVEPHEGLQPLQLVSQGMAGPVQLYPQLDIALGAQERAAARATLDILVKADQGPLLGFFAEATGKKRLSPEWWQDWLDAMRQSKRSFRLLQILPPGETPPLEPDMPYVREPGHRRLAAMLGELDLFVSCDAGPMHLAAAAGARTVGLFHATSIARYQPLGADCVALDIKDLTPAQVATAVLARVPEA